MKQGARIIFNEDYIDEVVRHRDIAQRKYDVENMPQQKEKALKELESWEKRLEWAEEFQDTIQEIRHTDIPALTVVKTMGGYELPLNHIQMV